MPKLSLNNLLPALTALTLLAASPSLACADHGEPPRKADAQQEASAISVSLADITPASGDNTAKKASETKGISVKGQAFAYQTSPAQKNGAVFLTLFNSASKDISLVNAHAAIADRTEIHTMSMDDGVMEMRKLEKISISAGDSHNLKPMGDHIMLLGLKAQLILGRNFPLTLHFDDGTTLDIAVKVVPAGQNPNVDSSSHNSNNGIDGTSSGNSDHDHHGHYH